MNAALMLARFFLAVAFLIAGLAKILDRSASAKMIAEFGLPLRAAGVLGAVLPLIALGVGLALLTSSLARQGSVAACALLALFMLAIGINLALGRKPNCNCFGQLRPAPISVGTLIR